MVERLLNIMNERRTINVDKKCFNTVNSYCDENGLKPSRFITSAILNEISRRKCHVDPVLIESDDVGVKTTLFTMFYDVLEVKHNLAVWVDDIIKNGNSYVKLNITPEGIISYTNIKYAKRIEYAGSTTLKFKCENEETLVDFYEMLHFRYLGNMDSLPYGVAVEFVNTMFSSSVATSNNRRVSRMCRIMESELNRAAIVHLYAMGYRGDELTNFTININEEFLKSIIQENFSSDRANKQSAESFKKDLLAEKYTYCPKCHHIIGSFERLMFLQSKKSDKHGKVTDEYCPRCGIHFGPMMTPPLKKSPIGK